MSLEHRISKEEREKKKQVFLFSLILLVVVIFIGTLGYKSLFDLSWVDAFTSATLIFSGRDSIEGTITTAQKLFLSFYTLVAMVIFISVAAKAIENIIQLFEKS